MIASITSRAYPHRFGRVPYRIYFWEIIKYAERNACGDCVSMCRGESSELAVSSIATIQFDAKPYFRLIPQFQRRNASNQRHPRKPDPAIALAVRCFGVAGIHGYLRADDLPIRPTKRIAGRGR